MLVAPRLSARAPTPAPAAPARRPGRHRGRARRRARRGRRRGRLGRCLGRPARPRQARAGSTSASGRRSGAWRCSPASRPGSAPAAARSCSGCPAIRCRPSSPSPCSSPRARPPLQGRDLDRPLTGTAVARRRRAPQPRARAGDPRAAASRAGRAVAIPTGAQGSHSQLAARRRRAGPHPGRTGELAGGPRSPCCARGLTAADCGQNRRHGAGPARAPSPACSRSWSPAAAGAGELPARAVIVSPRRSTVIAARRRGALGAVGRAHRLARPTSTGSGTPTNLENLARTYWRFLSARDARPDPRRSTARTSARSCCSPAR